MLLFGRDHPHQPLPQAAWLPRALIGLTDRQGRGGPAVDHFGTTIPGEVRGLE